MYSKKIIGILFVKFGEQKIILTTSNKQNYEFN